MSEQEDIATTSPGRGEGEEGGLRKRDVPSGGKDLTNEEQQAAQESDQRSENVGVS